MQLLPQLVTRLVMVTTLCLAAAIAWIVFDAHRSVEREAELSAGREVEILSLVARERTHD
jgi:hypothetical protein